MRRYARTPIREDTPKEVADTSMPVWLGAGAAAKVARTSCGALRDCGARPNGMSKTLRFGGFTVVPECFTAHVVLSLHWHSSPGECFWCDSGRPCVSTHRRIQSVAYPLLCTGLCLRAPHWPDVGAGFVLSARHEPSYAAVTSVAWCGEVLAAVSAPRKQPV